MASGSRIRDWSTNPANNELTVPFGAPINWYPSEVSPWSRQTMASIRTQWENAEWFNWGHVATQTGATTFTVPTDVTSVYLVGRRLRITDATVLTGTITASAYSSPNTTVTVLLDSGALSSTMNGQNVEVGVVKPGSNGAVSSRYAFSVFRSGFQGSAPGLSQIGFNAVLKDPYGFFNVGGSFYQPTFKCSLFVTMAVSINLSAPSTGDGIRAHIAKNGSIVKTTDISNQAGALGMSVNLSGIIDLNGAGDSVSGYIFNNTNQNGNLVAAPDWTYMDAMFI
jgi:hypothetical protein